MKQILECLLSTAGNLLALLLLFVFEVDALLFFLLGCLYHYLLAIFRNRIEQLLYTLIIFGTGEPQLSPDRFA